MTALILTHPRFRRPHPLDELKAWTRIQELRAPIDASDTLADALESTLRAAERLEAVMDELAKVNGGVL